MQRRPEPPQINLAKSLECGRSETPTLQLPPLLKARGRNGRDRGREGEKERGGDKLLLYCPVIVEKKVEDRRQRGQMSRGGSERR